MPETAILKLNISGMHCGACVKRVRSAIQSLPGADPKSVEVGSAEIAFDPASVSPKAITEAVRKAGFEPSTT